MTELKGTRINITYGSDMYFDGIEFNNHPSEGIMAGKFTIQKARYFYTIFIGPVSDDNILVWEALIQGPSETPYENGIFVARLNFPSDYPLNPPSMRFVSPITHPNIYKDGRVCISILHHPGEDPMMYESSSERWSPVQSVEKILMSVLSMLAGT